MASSPGSKEALEMTMSTDRSPKTLVSVTGVVLVALFLPLSAASQGETSSPPEPQDQKVEAVQGVQKEILLKTEPESGEIRWVLEKSAEETFSLESDGPKVTFKSNESGEITFTFTVENSDGVSSGAATVTVNVVEAIPTVKDQEIEVLEDGERAFALQIEYIGNKDNLEYNVVPDSKPKHGELPETGKAQEVVIFKATETNFTGSDQFQVTVKDKVTEEESGVATIKVKIVPPPTELQKIVQAAKDELPGQYDPANIRTTANCSLRTSVTNGTQISTHTCSPRGITVSADQVSTVIVELPDGVTRVSATANESWTYPELNSHTVRFGVRDDSDTDTDSDTKFESLKHCDEAPGDLLISIYRQKLIGPSYIKGNKPSSIKGNKDGKRLSGFRPVLRAATVLRGKSGQNFCELSLLVSGDHDILKIDVGGITDDGTPYSNSFEIKLLFYRWLVDIGGFYAMRRTGDEMLVSTAIDVETTVPPPDGEGGPGTMTTTSMTSVLRIHEPDYTSDSGVMMNFFKASYPKTGLGFGIAFPSSRSPTFYLGLSYRLINLGQNAVATFTGGVVASEILTFPQIEEGMMYMPNDPLLKGSMDYDLSGFLTVTLGFSLPNQPK